jgi:hypothetical protein
MRVFICAFAGFSVAIPMESVSSLMLYTNRAPQTVERNPQNGNTYISLPRLFSRPFADIRHGIILKNGNDDFDETTENRIILLSTKVECEAEIPSDQIYPLPKIFDFLRFSAFFNGILFNSDNEADHPMLLLDTAALVEKIQKELTV